MPDGLLSADTILTLSERESGAYGLADEGLRGRVAAMVDTLNARGPFPPSRLRAIRAQLQQLLTTRLRLALDRARNPAIAEVRIERPIFIIGLVRTGTTLLHSLLAEDPEVLTPQAWHLTSPSPPPGAVPVVPERIAFAQRKIEAWMDFCPGQKVMHPYIDKGAYQLCEDEEIYNLDFRNAYCYHLYEAPIDSAMVLLDGDLSGTFDFHRSLLQHLQWKTDKTQWICKGVSHSYYLSALFEAYPDALCVWPHRPIAEILPSITMLSGVIYDAIRGEAADPGVEGRVIAQGMRMGFDTLFQSDLIDDPRILHMNFREIASDPVSAVGKIYDRAGRPVTAAFEQAMRAWLADPANASDRYGRYPYSPESVGLTTAWMNETFADYSARFKLD